MDDTEIVIGTYENLLLGYKLSRKFDDTLTLQSSFTDDSHRGAIRCLTVSHSGILASSSTDDSVRLHSLKKRKEVGALFQHNGSVNSLRFFKGGHMLSASEDGTIGLWKCRSWELLRLLKGHKSHVKAVAVHPSGKLGFSVGSDRSLITWDFTTGKVAFKTHMEKVAEDILFTKDGNHYVLVYQKAVDVCSVEDTKVLHEIDYGSRINSVSLIKRVETLFDLFGSESDDGDFDYNSCREDDVLAIGGDDRHILIVNILSQKELLKIDCGEKDQNFVGRIRCLSTVIIEEEMYLVMSTTSGSVKIFSIDINEESLSSRIILSFETGVRVTCMTAYNSSPTSREDLIDRQLDSKRSKTKRRAKKNKTKKIEDNTEGNAMKNDESDIEDCETEELFVDEEDPEVCGDKQVEKRPKKDLKRMKRKSKEHKKSAEKIVPVVSDPPKKKRKKF